MRDHIKIKTDKSITVEIVGGAQPYVWIGDGDGRYLGTVDDARELRDALTKALKDARATSVPERAALESNRRDG